MQHVSCGTRRGAAQVLPGNGRRRPRSNLPRQLQLGEMDRLLQLQIYKGISQVQRGFPERLRGLQLRTAYGEYNAMLDEILGDDRYDKVRDTVVALAEERRDHIIESAQRVRDHVIGRARDRRDRLITATQTRRESVIVSAATHGMQHSSGPPSCVTKASATNDGPWEL
jgi:hypothetical protein